MAKQLIATLVTNSNGEAFYTYTGTGAGQTTFMAESGELESNSLTINDINQELTITVDKNILSYVDNESCTITATYEGPSVDGQTVVFKNEDTILATKTTDSNGIATYDYQSQGVGDVTFTVECMNLQETYELEDCTFYDDQSSNKVSQYTARMSSATPVYNTDHLTLIGNTNDWALASVYGVSTANNFLIEAELSTPSSFLELGYWLSGTYHISTIGYPLDSKFRCYNYANSPSLLWEQSQTVSKNTYYKVQMSLENGTLTFKVWDSNNTLLFTKTASLPSNYQNTTVYPCFGVYGQNNAVNMKKLKVKPL